MAKKNVQVSRETLDLTKQRFEAGVTDSVEVVQSEQTVASAELDYINSEFGLNLGESSAWRAPWAAQRKTYRNSSKRNDPPALRRHFFEELNRNCGVLRAAPRANIHPATRDLLATSCRTTQFGIYLLRIP